MMIKMTAHCFNILGLYRVRTCVCLKSRMYHDAFAPEMDGILTDLAVNYCKKRLMLKIFKRQMKNGDAF